jgi:hypothetical protein
VTGWKIVAQLIVYDSFKLISGFEPNYLAGWDSRLLTGFGVTPDAGMLISYVKGPEAPQDDSITLL